MRCVQFRMWIAVGKGEERGSKSDFIFLPALSDPTAFPSSFARSVD